MLNVLHVAKYYPPVPGGMERVVASLCEATASRLTNQVLAFQRGTHTSVEETQGVRVTRVATIGQAGSVPISPAFPLHLRRARADVAILHEPNPWALVSWIAARPRMPLIIWFHSAVIRPRLQYKMFYEPVARAVYRHARRFVVSSQALADTAAALQPYRDKVEVIPFGIDVDAWRGASPSVPCARNGRGQMLFVGRLVPYKGVDVLIRAAAPLDVDVVIAGDGPMRDEWQRLANEVPGRARFIFTGEIPDDDLKARVRAADALVLPSTTPAEAFGLVQLEAMASGKPVISTAVDSGVSWVNRDGETGLVVTPGAIEDLRQAIQRLNVDPQLRARLGEAGRARAIAHFTIDTMGERVAALCERVARS